MVGWQKQVAWLSLNWGIEARFVMYEVMRLFVKGIQGRLPAARKGGGREAKLCYAGHTLTENRHGLIVECELTQATGTAEREAGLRLVARRRARQGGRLSVGADKGYDSDDVRASLLLKGILPVIPPKANRREAIACDFRAYKDRNRVERMFNRLKQFRRIATRYDKTAVSFLGFLALAAAKLWMPTYVNRT
jgi:transposase